MKFQTIVSITAMAISMAACKPNAPPPDLLKSQHEALDKAKAVEGQLQQQADQQRKAIDDAEK